MHLLQADSLTKIFRLYQKPSDRLRELVWRRPYHRIYTALKRVSFTLQPGETLGIVGQNGSGKSTLLKILTGVLLPDTGSYQINGRIAGLLELGTGFNPEFTGLDNIYLNGTYLGLSKPDIDARLQAIIAFAELGEFIHEPLKTYSSGMAMRLAFATAIHTQPDCFVVDEALSVGDIYFQQKCMQRLREYKQQGGAIIFVSHDLNAVKLLCERALLLEKGRKLEEGDPDRVINAYNLLLAQKGLQRDLEQQAQGNGAAYGNHKVRISQVQLKNETGQGAETFISGRPLLMELLLTAQEDTPEISVGMLVRDKFGQDIFGTNGYMLQQLFDLRAGQQARVRFEVPALNLGAGGYTITVAAHRGENHLHECNHWIDQAAAFEVVAGHDHPFSGLVRLAPQLQIDTAEPAPAQANAQTGT